MKRIAAVLLVAALYATARQRPPSYDVIASIRGGLSIDPIGLGRAQARATSMFAEVGIRVGWTFRPWRPGEDNSECGAGTPMKLTIELVREGKGSGLGYAHPYASRDRVIVIRYDRLDLAYTADLREALLAHVLVHEITHALQGIAIHDETGMMQAEWSTSQVLQMVHNPLSFTREAVALMHAGLKKACPALSVIFP